MITIKLSTHRSMYSLSRVYMAFRINSYTIIAKNSMWLIVVHLSILKENLKFQTLPESILKPPIPDPEVSVNCTLVGINKASFSIRAPAIPQWINSNHNNKSKMYIWLRVTMP